MTGSAGDPAMSPHYLAAQRYLEAWRFDASDVGDSAIVDLAEMFASVERSAYATAKKQITERLRNRARQLESLASTSFLDYSARELRSEANWIDSMQPTEVTREQCSRSLPALGATAPRRTFQDQTRTHD